MARGSHGLPKVSLKPTMPYLLRPAGVTPLEGGHHAAIFYPLGHPTPYVYAHIALAFGENGTEIGTEMDDRRRPTHSESGQVVVTCDEDDIREVVTTFIYHAGHKKRDTFKLLLRSPL
jgi:hypothetical protein